MKVSYEVKTFINKSKKKQLMPTESWVYHHYKTDNRKLFSSLASCLREECGSSYMNAFETEN